MYVNSDMPKYMKDVHGYGPLFVPQTLQITDSFIWLGIKTITDTLQMLESKKLVNVRS